MREEVFGDVDEFVVFSEMFASYPFVNACLLMRIHPRESRPQCFCFLVHVHKESRRRFANIPLAKDVEMKFDISFKKSCFSEEFLDTGITKHFGRSLVVL